MQLKQRQETNNAIGKPLKEHYFAQRRGRVLGACLGFLLLVLVFFVPLFFPFVGQAHATTATPAADSGVAENSIASIQIPPNVIEYDLKPHWESVLLEKKKALRLHPQQIWSMPKNQFDAGVKAKKMDVDSSLAYWARFTIYPQRDSKNGDTGYLLVPSATIDAVYIWIRPQGEDWQPAVIAGDTFAKTNGHGAIQSNFAAVALPTNAEAVDVVVRMENHFNLFIRMLWLETNFFHESYFYTNRSLGASMGEAGAILILTLSAFALLRRREFLVVGLYCFTAILHVVAYSGSGRDMIWGVSSHLNAVSIEMTSYFVNIAMLLVVWSLTSKQLLNKQFASATWGMVLAGIAILFWVFFYGYDSAFSNWVLFFYTIGVSLLSLVMSMTMLVLRKDRIAMWVLAGVVAYLVFIALISISRYFLLPRDYYYTIAGVVFTLSAVIFFASAYGRYRFGHTVLSEEMMLNTSVDNLTGLLDKNGLTQAIALHNLRNTKREAGNALSPVIVVRLRKVEDGDAKVRELGSAAVEAAQIRLAYVLKNEFQDVAGGANVARVQEGCFVLFLEQPMERNKLQQHATRIVTQLLTMDDLPPYKTVMGLQIVLDQIPAFELSALALQKIYHFGNRHAEDPRAILWFESSSLGGGGLGDV